jgi:hypothetical protein
MTQRTDTNTGSLRPQAETAPSNVELASLLDDHANSLIEGGKADHGFEPFVRLAAERLRDCEPTPAVVALITALRQAAHETSDSRTAAALRGVLGEFGLPSEPSAKASG